MTSHERFEFGEKVRHRNRPEWGVGTVTRVEASPDNGQMGQRLTIRFPNAGTKVLSTLQASLERIVAETASTAAGHPSTIAGWDRVHESEWLAPMARKKIDELMISLPEEAKDPFSSVGKRLRFTLHLYRFDRSPRGLIDWAVAQTGLDDPLVRFTRQELEQKHERWIHELDNHLRKLVQELNHDRGTLNELLGSAPAGARQAVQRLTARR